MSALLKDGPLDREVVSIPDESIRYTTRVAGRRVVYDANGAIDPVTSNRVFTFQSPAPGQNSGPTDSDQEDDVNDA
jgi:hypothetical protein